MKLCDGFPTKKGAQDLANSLRMQGVQYVRVRPINQGRLKYGVYVGGRNSSMY